MSGKLWTSLGVLAVGMLLVFPLLWIAELIKDPQFIRSRARDRVQTAEERLAAVERAIERFHETRGRFPERLTELSILVEKQDLEDPFGASGSTFRYQREDERTVRIYSVGPNLTDDGGDLSFDASDRTNLGGDIVKQVTIPSP